MRRAGVATLLAMLGTLVACRHGEVLRVSDYGTDSPFFPGEPTRLTLSLANDRDPAWLPDGSGILYTRERPDRADKDWCFAVMPPRGGRITREICNDAAPAADSTDTFERASVSSDGRLAYLRSSGPTVGWPNLQFDAHRYRELAAAPLAAPLEAQVIVSLPATLPGGRLILGASQIRWLDSISLVYRGDFDGWVCLVPGPNCAQTHVITGLGLVYQTLGAAGSKLQLPGTDFASSVAVGAGYIYYTLGGDSRVYARSTTTGVTTTIWDFGAAGIARDVQVLGRKLIAVVGGNVSFTFIAALGYPVQVDNGGRIHVVDLLTGTDVVLSAGPRLFRHLALAPSGASLVAESFSGSATDLYLLGVP